MRPSFRQEKSALCFLIQNSGRCGPQRPAQRFVQNDENRRMPQGEVAPGRYIRYAGTSLHLSVRDKGPAVCQALFLIFFVGGEFFILHPPAKPKRTWEFYPPSGSPHSTRHKRVAIHSTFASPLSFVVPTLYHRLGVLSTPFFNFFLAILDCDLIAIDRNLDDLQAVVGEQALVATSQIHLPVSVLGS